MAPRTLIQLAGLAAMLGGGARIFSAFPLLADPISREWLYAGVDVLLVLGLIGVYLMRAEKLGFLGLASFITAMAGFSFIGGPDADPFGFSTYEQGAAVVAIAMAGLSIAWLRVRERPIAAPLLWVSSLIVAGVLSATQSPLSQHGFLIAGALFGAGFIVAGYDLVRR